MRRILIFCILASLAVFALTGCEIIEKIVGSHEHIGGKATCLSEAICEECGQKYGEKAEHSYIEATCTEDAYCAACKTKLQNKLGHNFTEATCESPATCERCGITEGEPVHKYNDFYSSDDNKHWIECRACGVKKEQENHDSSVPTCTEDAVCSVCDAICKERLGHDFTEATCDAPATCNRCGLTEGDVAHSFDTVYSYDENKHWIECTACGKKTNEGNHTGGKATVNKKAECEICGAMYGEYLEKPIDWKIEAVLPANGASVCLANKLVTEWYESFNYRTTDTNSYMTGEDIFIPDVPILKWTVGDAAKYYKVYIATSADMANSECYLTNLNELLLEHLYVGRTYFWYVDAVYAQYTVRSEVFTFTTSHTPRTVNVEGVSNMRDIGGYVTADGMRIKQGMIYRSAKLDDVTEVGKYTLVYLLGIKTDLDLRGARTSDGNGGVYSDPRNATHPITELNHITVACPWYSTGENGIWYDGFNKREFADAIKVFANPDNYPIIFHCSLGRDRTGTLALVLEGLLGLDENTLMMEYELSAFSYWGAYNASYNNSLRNNIHDTYLYINNNYEGENFSEKVEDFLLDIGVTEEEIASIRSIMLEEAE